MKVLFHTINFFPNTEADARRIYGLASNLEKLGCTVDVVTTFPDKVKKKKRKLWFVHFFKKEYINKIKVYRYFTIPYHNRNTFFRLLNNLSFAISSLFHLFCFKKYDFVITSSPPLLISFSGYIISKFKGAKLIFDCRDIWPDIALEMGKLKRKSLVFKIFNIIALKMYKKSILITTVSHLKVKNIQKKIKTNKAKVKYISNGVDDFFLKLIENKKFLNEFKINNFFSIVHIGKIGKAQDIDSFLNLAQAFKNQKNLKFYLIGDGIERKRILKRIENEKIFNVIYCGRRTMAEVYTAYKYAKVSYVSLVNEKLLDSVPTKLYEALFCGCPVLLSAKGEAVQILKEAKLGLSCIPGDFNSLKANFSYLINNYHKIIKNKMHCYNYINENYNRKQIALKLYLLLKKERN